MCLQTVELCGVEAQKVSAFPDFTQSLRIKWIPLRIVKKININRKLPLLETVFVNTGSSVLVSGPLLSARGCVHNLLPGEWIRKSFPEGKHFLIHISGHGDWGGIQKCPPGKAMSIANG